MKINLLANGKKYNWGFWRSILYFFFASLDSLDGLHIKTENLTLFNTSEKVLFREFYTFRAFVKFCFSTPLWYMRTGAEQFAKTIGLSKKLAFQIGAIALDAVTSDVVATTGLHTFSHTTSGNNRLLVIGVSAYNGESSWIVTDGVTYNSVVTTLAVKSNNQANFVDSGIFYLVAPATGANTVSVDYTQADKRSIVGAISYTGVLQTSPLDQTSVVNSANAADVSVSVTPTENNELVISCHNVYDQTVTVNKTQQWNINVAASIRGVGQDEIQTTAGATTHTFTHAAQERSACIASFKAAAQAAASGGLLSLKVG